MGMFYDLLLAQREKKPPVEEKEPIWCEYLESNGNQWIDTGVKPNQDTGISLTLSNITNTYFAPVFNASLQNSPNTRYSFFMTVNASQFMFKDKWALNIDLVNIKDKFVLSCNREKAYKDGVELPNAPLVYSNFQNKNNLILFKDVQYNRYPGVSGRVYSVQMYDNGALIRNYRPCLHPETFKPALYDTVTKTYYYNQGDKEDFKYNIEFVKLDYITFTGSQQIDIKYLAKAKGDYRFESWVKFNEPLKVQACGEHSGAAGAYWKIDNRSGKFVYDLGGTGQTTKAPSTVSFDHVVLDVKHSIRVGYLYVNNDTDKYDSFREISVDGASRIYIGGLDQAYAGFNMNCDFKKVKITDLNTGFLKKDIIPARMNDGRVGLYDFVQGEIYTSVNADKVKGFLNGYQIGEYIKGSNMRTCIDTPSVATGKSRVVMLFSLTQIEREGIMGSRSDFRNRRFNLFISFPYSGEWRFYSDYGNGDQKPIPDITPQIGVIYRLDKNGATTIINDSKPFVDLGQDFTTPTVLRIMRVANSGFDNLGLLVRYFSFYEAGILNYILVPAKKDGFIGLIDTLTLKEYANASTYGEILFQE